MTEVDDPVQAELAQAKADLAAGRIEAAQRRAASVLAVSADHQDALYISAVANRYAKEFNAASEVVDRLIALSPEYGRAHQERGHLFKAQGRENEALAAYRYAAQLNPSLVASVKGAAELAARREPAAAQAAQAELKRLSNLPKPLLAVMNHLAEGRILKAEDICRAFLKKNPTHTEGMRLLADIGMRLSVLDDAEFLLESAVALEPKNAQLRLDYIQVLRKRQKHDAALQEAKHLYQQDKTNPLFQSHLAVESMQVGDYEQAFALFDAVLDKLPGDPVTLTSKGHALKTYGDQEKAVDAYRAATTSSPGHADAYYALANLKTYRFTDEEIEAMQVQAAQPGMPFRQLIHFHFALGKAFEDRKDFAVSFSHYEKGNELKRIQSRYDPDQMEQEFRAQMEVCGPDLFGRQAGKGCPAQDPIFIVGLPRAGSTLLEQILASHSQVDGTMELPNVLALAHRLRSNGPISKESLYPQVLNELSAEELHGFGKAFIEETRVHRQGAPRFIDKMPNNFRHIGLIHLILPNAKIIDARREPMACCFSGFKQLFAEGQEFTYGLEQIGRYYRGYVELMAHWDRVLPDKVLRVQYEDVVDDLEAQVRRVLDFCGLPFEEACLNFHKTKRSVRTASSEQVRQPLYRSGVDQWRQFDAHLAPLKDALGPALQGYRA
ncbi:MAG: sulfotransferase [Pseudomonadota bacterium]